MLLKQQFKKSKVKSRIKKKVARSKKKRYPLVPATYSQDNNPDVHAGIARAALKRRLG